MNPCTSFFRSIAQLLFLSVSSSPDSSTSREQPFPLLKWHEPPTIYCFKIYQYHKPNQHGDYCNKWKTHWPARKRLFNSYKSKFPVLTMHITFSAVLLLTLLEGRNIRQCRLEYNIKSITVFWKMFKYFTPYVWIFYWIRLFLKINQMIVSVWNNEINELW